MELFFLILIILIIIYFVSKSINKKSKKISYSVTINDKPISLSSEKSNYEDPWLDLNDDKKEEFESYSYPLFTILQKYSEVFAYINPKFHSLAQELAKQKSEEIQNAIYSLLNQEKFRLNKGLPKYLQVVPINTLIKKNIFVTAQKNDLPRILDSMTMDSLKEICSKKDIKPARSKKETIQKLLEIDLSDVINYESFFRLNPDINIIFEEYKKFCHILIERAMSKRKIRIKNVTKKLDPNELHDEINRNEYSLKEYGYQSMIFFKQGKPIFRIIETDRFYNNVILLDFGLLAIVQRVSLDRASLVKGQVNSPPLGSR